MPRTKLEDAVEKARKLRKAARRVADPQLRTGLQKEADEGIRRALKNAKSSRKASRSRRTDNLTNLR